MVLPTPHTDLVHTPVVPTYPPGGVNNANENIYKLVLHG